MNRDLRILLIGEGNFSFTYSLVKKISKSKRFDRWGRRNAEQICSSNASCIQHESKKSFINKGLFAHEESIAENNVALDNNESNNDSSNHRCDTSKKLTLKLSEEVLKVEESGDNNKLTCFIWATTYDDMEEVTCKYPESVPIIKYLHEKKRIKIEILDNVNGVNLCETLKKATKSNNLPHFHLIYFNNPHVGMEDMHLHRMLLAHFFFEVRKLIFETKIRENADYIQQTIIGVALCDDQPQQWQLQNAAAQSGFIAIAAVPVSREEFPEYYHRRHQNDNAFPCKNMIHYYFEHESEVDQSEYEELNKLIEQNYNLKYCLNKEERLIAESREQSLSEEREKTLELFDCSRCKQGHDHAVNPEQRYSSLLRNSNSNWYGLPLLTSRVAYHEWGEKNQNTTKRETTEKNPKEKDALSYNEDYMPYLFISELLKKYDLEIMKNHESQNKKKVISLELENAGLIPEHQLIARNNNEYKILRKNLHNLRIDTEAIQRVNLTQTIELCNLEEIYTKQTKNEDEETQFLCTLCTPISAYSTFDSLKKHTEQQHHEEVEREDIEYRTSANQLETIYEELAKKVWCSICKKVFISKNAKEIHLAKLSPDKGKNYHQCYICEPMKMFQSSRALLQHQRSKHYKNNKI